jgi:site-specific DNA-methyltransferase (adenine-specific)
MIKKIRKFRRAGMVKPYFERTGFVLYHEDCLKILSEIAENSVDLIFADPPYFLSNGTFTCHAGKAVSVKKADWDMGESAEINFNFHLEWIKACRRVLKPNGTIWISGTYHSIYQCGYALQLAGYHILNDIAWYKPNVLANISYCFFNTSHETFIWAKKDRKAKHTFNYELAKKGDWPEDQLKRKDKQMRSVWSIRTTTPSEKIFGTPPTHKPLDLLIRIILLASNEGELVLEVFTRGSATGIAACALGRRFIGIGMAEFAESKKPIRICSEEQIRRLSLISYANSSRYKNCRTIS